LSTISTICEELTKELRIERRSEHGGQVITILNYEELQPLKKREPNDEANDTRTIPEHNKNDKNVKNYIKPFLGEFKNVKLTEHEFKKLKLNFNSSFDIKIETLSRYIENFPKKANKYKSHYATILTWDRNEKKKSGEKKILTGKEALEWEG
jgi:hypothetical protein